MKTEIILWPSSQTGFMKESCYPPKAERRIDSGFLYERLPVKTLSFPILLLLLILFLLARATRRGGEEENRKRKLVSVLS